MTTTIRAMRPEDVPHVLDVCQEWEELSRFGPPYWRPRSSAELQRKISTPAGPQPATAYSFVIINDGRLVGECSLHAIDWRNRHTQVGICVWRPEDRRHGYGRAGVEFLISWATPKPRPPPSKNGVCRTIITIAPTWVPNLKRRPTVSLPHPWVARPA